MVLIAAGCYNQIAIRVGRYRGEQMLEQDAADLGWPAEVCIVLHRVAHLRQCQQFLAGQISGRPWWKASKIPRNLQVRYGGQSRLGMLDEISREVRSHRKTSVPRNQDHGAKDSEKRVMHGAHSSGGTQHLQQTTGDRRDL